MHHFGCTAEAIGGNVVRCAILYAKLVGIAILKYGDGMLFHPTLN